MIQLCVRMRAKSPSQPSVIKALKSITREAQLERGFIDGRIYQHVDDPDVLCLEQDWSTAGELDSHIRSICFTNLLQIIETAAEVPVLEVHVISAVRGLEYFNSIRFRGD